MKVLFNKNGLIATSLVLLISSCTADFESINKDVRYPDEHQKTLDGLASVGLFPDFISGIIPVVTKVGDTKQANDYQTTSNMTGDIWSGYVGVGTQWDGGTSTPNLFIADRRRSNVYKDMLLATITPFMAIKAATHDVKLVDGQQVFEKRDLTSQANYSVAQIIKVMGIHRLTDLYGPIPYSKIGAGKFEVPYDSQEQVYRSMLSELQEAVQTLNEYLSSGTDGATILLDNDSMFQGSVAKWIKLGNSLMLRLAIRVRYADPALAAEYVTKATTNPGGLMESKNDEAKLVSNGRFRFVNPMPTLKGYGELNVGANILSYMQGYNDPRMEKYFTKKFVNGQEGYYGVRMGVRKPKANYVGYSELNVEEATPLYWMKASEVQFLLAEARLFDLISTGTAQEYYQRGVEMSFAENDLSVGNYLTTSGLPAAYSDPDDNEHNAPAVSTIDKKWDDNATDEENLERIITQKYIAIFPLGLEAWSEWRRTGYPRMFKEVVNLSNVDAPSITSNGKEGGIRRVPFSVEEYTNNQKNMSNAVSLLGGADNAATKVWWDKK